MRADYVDENGLVKQEIYDIGVEILPIPCTDIVLVNSQKQIGVIIRATGPEAGKFALTGGRSQSPKTKPTNLCGSRRRKFQTLHHITMESQ